MLQTLQSSGTFGGDGALWSADPSGQHLIIGGTDVTGVRKIPHPLKVAGHDQVWYSLEPVERTVFGRLDHGRFTVLPDRPAPGRPARQDQAGVW